MICNYNKVCPIYFGEGRVKETGNILRTLGCTRKIMLLTDSVFAQQGGYANCKKSIQEAGLEIIEYTDVKPDPPESVINEAGAIIQKERVDGIVAIGGGSTMDTGKCLAVLAENPLPIHQYLGKGMEFPADFPLVCIPTASGTGAEVSRIAVVTNKETGGKFGLRRQATAAILDPELTVTAPPSVTAASAMDALAHAVEILTLWDVPRPLPGPNPRSLALVKESIGIIRKYAPIAVEDGTNMEARTQLSIASNLAGIALNDTGCHIGHAIAQGIGGLYHLPHGVCCGLALPAVVKFVADRLPEKARLVAKALGLPLRGEESATELKRVLVEEMTRILTAVRLPSYKTLGKTRDEIVAAADAVMVDGNFVFVMKPLEKGELEYILGDMYDMYQ